MARQSTLWRATGQSNLADKREPKCSCISAKTKLWKFLLWLAVCLSSLIVQWPVFSLLATAHDCKNDLLLGFSAIQTHRCYSHLWSRLQEILSFNFLKIYVSQRFFYWSRFYARDGWYDRMNFGSVSWARLLVRLVFWISIDSRLKGISPDTNSFIFRLPRSEFRLAVTLHFAETTLTIPHDGNKKQKTKKDNNSKIWCFTHWTMMTTPSPLNNKKRWITMVLGQITARS